MPMTLEEARAVERAPIEVGGIYTFFSEVHDVTVKDTIAHLNPSIQDETPLRVFTGERVEVMRQLLDWGEEQSAMYRVRLLRTGTEFVAMGEELNGWDYDLGQFYGPSGIWGSTE